MIPELFCAVNKSHSVEENDDLNVLQQKEQQALKWTLSQATDKIPLIYN